MYNTKVLEYCKDKVTDNKYRWCGKVDKTSFSLYIPKWRVPQPVSRRVRISIFLADDKHQDLSQLKCNDAISAPEKNQSPIVAKVRYTSEHTKTIRYDPIGNPKDLEIGSPYIPKKLLPEVPPSELTISVEWLAG